MTELPENPNSLPIPEKKDLPRYGEYRIGIPIEAAKEEIERNFPELKIEEIKCHEVEIGGKNNVVFLVNEEFIFRFAKQERANASVEREIKALPEIQKHVSVAVPNFEYIGRQKNQMRIVGYKMIRGDRLKKEELVESDGKINSSISKQIADFFRQTHSINTADAKRWGILEENTRSQYEKLLSEARKYAYNLIEEMYPDDAVKIKDYVEKLFAGYLNDEGNFTYTPAVMHSDLGPEHIIFDEKTRKIVGIIDWGGAKISDPDYDIFRLYRDFGVEFINEFLKYYPHDDVERFMKKLDFFFRAHMVRHIVSTASIGDKENAEWNVSCLRKQALGLGYWPAELKDEEPGQH